MVGELAERRAFATEVAEGREKSEHLDRAESVDDSAALNQSPDTTPVQDDPLGALHALVAGLKIPRDKFERYARKKYGAGWCRNANGIKRVAGAIDGFKANGNGALAAIDAELEMFTSTD